MKERGTAATINEVCTDSNPPAINNTRPTEPMSNAQKHRIKTEGSWLVLQTIIAQRMEAESAVVIRNKFKLTRTTIERKVVKGKESKSTKAPAPKFCSNAGHISVMPLTSLYMEVPPKTQNQTSVKAVGSKIEPRIY